jgi:hypothetical protein
MTPVHSEVRGKLTVARPCSSTALILSSGLRIGICFSIASSRRQLRLDFTNAAVLCLRLLSFRRAACRDSNTRQKAVFRRPAPRMTSLAPRP